MNKMEKKEFEKAEKLVRYVGTGVGIFIASTPAAALLGATTLLANVGIDGVRFLSTRRRRKAFDQLLADPNGGLTLYLRTIRNPRQREALRRELRLGLRELEDAISDLAEEPIIEALSARARHPADPFPRACCALLSELTDEEIIALRAILEACQQATDWVALWSSLPSGSGMAYNTGTSRASTLPINGTARMFVLIQQTGLGELDRALTGSIAGPSQWPSTNADVRISRKVIDRLLPLLKSVPITSPPAHAAT